MSSKKISAICVYCNSAFTKNEKKTDDHLIARGFFLKESNYRDNLPKIPSCKSCNTKKSSLEDDLITVFAFGNPHPGGLEFLKNHTSRSLQKNLKLTRLLRENFKTQWGKNETGIISPISTINIDQFSEKIDRWFLYLTKGIYFWETDQPLPVDHYIHILGCPYYPDQIHLLKAALQLWGAPKKKLQGSSKQIKDFLYFSNISKDDPISTWGFDFKGFKKFCVTTSSEENPTNNISWLHCKTFSIKDEFKK